MRNAEIHEGDTLAVRTKRPSGCAKVEVVETNVRIDHGYHATQKGTRVKVISLHQTGSYGWLPFEREPREAYGGSPKVGETRVVANRNLWPWDEAAEAIVARVEEYDRREATRAALEEALGFPVKRGRHDWLEVTADDLLAVAAKLGVEVAA